MSVKHRRHSPGFKFRVALEAAKEQKTISQLSSELSLHPTQTSDCRAADCGGVRWKKQFLEKRETVFQPNGTSNGKQKLQIVQESELYEQIGRPGSVTVNQGASNSHENIITEKETQAKSSRFV